MTLALCNLSELYSAIQGEGPLVGTRQIFVRFSVCDLRCVWCDTPESLVKNEISKIESKAGEREFKKIKNPINVTDLITYTHNLNPNLHHSISLTGGEPLLHDNFLKEFLPKLKSKYQIPIYLETGGHRPDKLKEVVKYIDYISMDFKLPSSAKTGTFWDTHSEFLDIALTSENLLDIWVKIVITKDTQFKDIEKSLDIVKSNHGQKNLEVFLQPVTPINGSVPPSEKELLKVHLKSLEVYPNVRVLPQVHQLLGQK